MTPACGDSVRCRLNPQACQTSSGLWGELYYVYRIYPDGTRESMGTACLTKEEAQSLNSMRPTGAMVAEAFAELSWPAPELVVQPPDGRTLVNLDTNFYTTLTEVESQTVTLLGFAVEIEASPSSYTFDFGDGATEETQDPGAAYVEGEPLRVSHAYADAGVSLSPSVSVTYSGRYRVDGGPWEDIERTLTVAGPPVSLEVIEAEPRLNN